MITIKQCMFYESAVYKRNRKMDNGKPVGIVVHSTGANNPSLKRYVQPSKSDPNYNTIIKDIGVNKYNNSHNDPTGTVCVHAYIGKNAKGDVEVYECLPSDTCCWGVGAGTKGSYNYNPTAHYQFEICEDDLKSVEYFNKILDVSTEYCAILCHRFGISPYTVVSHKESCAKGYGSNHGDIDHWLAKYGMNMTQYRGLVKKKYDELAKSGGTLYRVQVGAFKNRENAENYLADLKKKGVEGFIVEVNTE